MKYYLKYSSRVVQTGLLTFVLVAGVLLPSAIIHADPDPTDIPDFEAAWSGGDVDFILPYDVATAPDETVYVADQNGHRIFKFDSDGTYITKWGTSGSGNGQFNSLRGVAVDSLGNVYVSDANNNRIQKFDSNGTYITKWGTSGSGNGQLSSPRDIAIDSDDNVYVADFWNARIQKFDADGTYLAQWGDYGSANGEFDDPHGITIDASNNVYVAELGNDRIQKFSSNGTYITKWGTNGSGNGQFSNPRGVTVDPAGHVYVLDTDNQRIQKFSSTGTYVTQWGSGGSNNGEFLFPYGIASNMSGDLYVADAGNSRIQKFSYSPASATLTSSSSGADIRLESANAFTTFTCNTSVAEASLDTQDPDKDYPLDLIDFCLDVPTGSTQTITVTIETDLSASDVTVRKYLPTSQTYQDVSDAVVTETTLDGNPALQLSYDITDGGELDDDGLANGTILDPVGLGTNIPTTTVPDDAATPTEANPDTLADTGESQVVVVFAAGLLVFAAAAVRKRALLG